MKYHRFSLVVWKKLDNSQPLIRRCPKSLGYPKSSKSWTMDDHDLVLKDIEIHGDLGVPF